MRTAFPVSFDAILARLRAELESFDTLDRTIHLNIHMDNGRDQVQHSLPRTSVRCGNSSRAV